MCPWPQCLGFRQPAAICGTSGYEPRCVVPEGEPASGHPLSRHKPQCHRHTGQGQCKEYEWNDYLDAFYSLTQSHHTHILCTSSLLVFSISGHLRTNCTIPFSSLPLQIIHRIVLILATITLWWACVCVRPFVCVRLRICVKCVRICLSVLVREGKGGGERAESISEKRSFSVLADCMCVCLC